METSNFVKGLDKYEIDTPALLLDQETLERNISRMAEYFEGKEAALRPHIKTHKTPIIAHKQTDAGARGITCAKLGEAEVMAAAGIKDILIANQIVGEKIGRLVNLAKHVDVIVAVDNLKNVDNLSRAALRREIQLDVLIEVDVRPREWARCGLPPGKPTLQFAEKVLKCEGLRFRGLMGYEAYALIRDFEERKAMCTQSMKLLVDTKNMLESSGIDVEIVSAGGTSTYNIAGEYPGITEVQAGSYVLMDTFETSIHPKPEFECALTVLTTVTSKPSKERAFIDAGKKAFTEEQGMPQPKDVKGIELYKLAEEHGYLRLRNPTRDIDVGDKLEFIPSHCCTTVNLYDNFYCIRNDKLEAIWYIMARGKCQ